MSDGVDCLSPISAVQAAALRRDGRTFALRYAVTKGGDSLSHAELATLHAAGLDVGVIYETTGNAALQGSAAGSVFGTRAAGALRTLGAPEGTAVYLAETDFDVQPQDFAAVRGFYSVASQVILLAGYRCGVYGGYRAMLAVSTLAVLRWQTYAWSGGQWAPGVALQQYGNGVALHGLTVDLDRALSDDWGQWRAQPQPHPHTEEDDMALVIMATQDAQGQSTGSYLVDSATGATCGIVAENAPTLPHITTTADGYNQFVTQAQKAASTGA